MNVDPIATQPVEIHDLAAEIERYLDVVALFRSLGHEPLWANDALDALELPHHKT